MHFFWHVSAACKTSVQRVKSHQQPKYPQQRCTASPASVAHFHIAHCNHFKHNILPPGVCCESSFCTQPSSFRMNKAVCVWSFLFSFQCWSCVHKLMASHVCRKKLRRERQIKGQISLEFEQDLGMTKCSWSIKLNVSFYAVWGVWGVA